MEDWIQKLKDAGAEEWSIQCDGFHEPTAQDDLVMYFMLFDTEN